MSGLFTGQDIIKQMIDGRLDATSLETLLADSYYLAGFTRAYQHPQTRFLLEYNDTAYGVFLGSATAFGILTATEVLELFQDSAKVTTLCTYGQTLANILNDPTYYEGIRQDSTAYTNLKNRVNQTGSKLKADVLTSDGTFTYHTGNTLLALSLSMCGGSGGGYVNNIGALTTGGGGSGSEFASKLISVGSLPSSNTSYTIGVAGATLTATSPTATSFGALLSATAGNNASGATAGSASGSTTNSGYSNTKIDVSFSAAAWQGDTTTTTIQGASGGSGGSYPGAGAAGGNGWAGSGGGAAGVLNAYSGRAGTAGGAGGGGGDATNNSNSAQFLGQTSSTYGAGGGGGNRTSLYNNYGGDGYQGVIRVMYVVSA